ncbi:MAG: pyrroloquinoline quinone-dependent dehydrogenase [Acidobacteria bacterium]|nr:pyrroloquinoline quinone-dependent dehydrogenase [Acidobacteriota bacterium]
MKKCASTAIKIAVLPLILLTAISASDIKRSAPEKGYRVWKVYGGGPESIRYSTLDRINRRNVGRLQVAWSFDTGDAYKDSEMQCNPIIVDGVLYATSPKLRVIALDAATGKLRWSFDPNEGKQVTGKVRNRGVTYWGEKDDRRIFVVARHFLYALNADNGKPIPSFGDSGRVDLREGLGRSPETLSSVSATTPGIVYKDLLILGSVTSEDLPAAPGDIRAYDVRSGKPRWTFHTIPRPGEVGYETWPKDAWTYTGGANCWAGMSLDERRGLVYAPTGSAAFDFYGANRVGDNLFANTLIALRADTGERVWHFQAVKHDVWDRDFSSPPSLVTVKRDGRFIDAVAQTTKSGHVFVFERETGKPLFPLEVREAPASDVDGELLAETQVFPLKPPPFGRQMLTEDLLTKRTPEAHKAVLERLRTLRNEGPFTPPSFQGSIVFPGFDGGAEWGGAAFDPETGLLYVNSNEMAWVLRLVERPKPKEHTSGRELYLSYCASCHGQDLRGTPPEFPSLVKIGDKYEASKIAELTRDGQGRMPGFAYLGEPAIEAITQFLVSGKETPVEVEVNEESPLRLKYTHDGYNKFLDPDGYPAVAPPWGTLNAINLDTGKIAWKIPLGEFPELAAKGMHNTGSENYGGPLVTAGGLLFIAATDHDKKFRAFDKATGKLLWETTLPAAGNATPATYEVDGRQFVVIGAGGGKWGAPSGGTYVAFTLPTQK